MIDKQKEYERYRRYNEKTKTYSVKYTIAENEECIIVQNAIEKSGLSSNAFIKQAIREKIERDNLI